MFYLENVSTTVFFVITSDVLSGLYSTMLLWLGVLGVYYQVVMWLLRRCWSKKNKNK